MAALARIREQTVEPRLLDGDGNPEFNVTYYVLAKSGAYAGVALYGGRSFAVCDQNGGRHEPIEGLIAERLG
jgi:hypothetical protein